jgi:hypothetical protein
MIQIGDKEVIFEKTIIAPHGVKVKVDEPFPSRPMLRMVFEIVFNRTDTQDLVSQWKWSDGICYLTFTGPVTPFSIGFDPGEIGKTNDGSSIGLAAVISATANLVTMHIQLLYGGTYAAK